MARNCHVKKNMLEHVAQTLLVLAGAYDTHNLVSLANDENSDARVGDENSASANNNFPVMI